MDLKGTRMDLKRNNGPEWTRTDPKQGLVDLRQGVADPKRTYLDLKQGTRNPPIPPPQRKASRGEARPFAKFNSELREIIDA